jgi:hypothetical protein
LKNNYNNNRDVYIGKYAPIWGENVKREREKSQKSVKEKGRRGKRQ